MAPKKRATRTRKPAKPAHQTTDQTTVPVGALIPQPHGGALRNGGTNKGGPGAPPKAIRELLRARYAERVGILEQIADGQAIQKVKIDGIETDTLISADVGDRLKALDQMARYGIGTTKEVSIEDVKDRLSNSLDAIRALPYPVTSAEQVIAAIKPFWS